MIISLTAILATYRGSGLPLANLVGVSPLSRRFSVITKCVNQGAPIKWGLTVQESSILQQPKYTSELQAEELPLQLYNVDDQIWQKVGQVKEILRSMGDGEISSSAYDTAWVAMVPAIGDGGRPQFPSSLQWIIDNQLDDGSWGDMLIFSAYDRILNTLACVTALKSWNICSEMCDKGLLFMKENMWRIAEEDDDEMTIGFEVAFPSLINIAKGLDLDGFPYDHPALEEIYAKRDLKLSKIPWKVMHEMPTSLLFSLEGMVGLQWDKLLQLQNKDGSFLFSPSSTAYALMQTGDHNCLLYLQNIVDKFNGGVPNVYPVDLFEHLWIVDKLQRLGVSRFFQAEIKRSMDYVSRYWTEKGICWARNTKVEDVDDTAMAFRLLRLHGYSVSADVFQHFEKDGEFFCLAGQSSQPVTAMFNLNRASQLIFPCEEILEKANIFSFDFLMANQLIDKWVIMKDLLGEVEYTLNFPFFTSLPRVEARWFVEQYGGSGDVWIGKALYRMLYVNNDLYLELAKADFNHCQSIHQLEWLDLQRWHKELALDTKGVSWRSLLKTYFLAAASIFEPDRSAERFAWSRTAVLVEAVICDFRNNSCTDEARQVFLQHFLSLQRHKSCPSDLVGSIIGLIDLLTHIYTSDKNHHQQLSPQLFRQHLYRVWKEWILTWTNNDEDTVLLLVRTIELCAGRVEPNSEPARHEYNYLARLTASTCKNLRVVEENKENWSKRDSGIEAKMKELIKCVLQGSNGLSNQTKQNFLSIAKSFFYIAHCSSSTLNDHIEKVLFEKVE